jgi:virulence factor
MKIAVIGLGAIAEKAYLPVLTAVPGLQLHLVTRSAERLQQFGERYNLPHRHSCLETVLEQGIDAAFVHVATSAHSDIVDQLLRAGVHVYVDKPLASSLGECTRLVELAEEKGRLLTVGFNRRYAPAYFGLQDCRRDLIIMQKNRRSLPAVPRQVIFDDFIHVVDTLRFLLPAGPERVSVEGQVREGLLNHVVVTLSGQGFTAIGMMNRMSGGDEESLEVMGAGKKRRVLNLRDVTDHRHGLQVLTPGPDWKPTTWVRGFDQMCARFLEDVRLGSEPDTRDALETHRLCELITGECVGLNVD